MSIFCLSLIFALTVSLVSYIVIVSNLYSNQVEKSESNTESAAKMTSAYIVQAMSFVENAASQSHFSSALSGAGIEIGDDLNRLCNYSVKIDGATLYGLSGYTTYSAGIGLPPTLDELKSEGDIAEFINSDKTTHISIRVTNVAAVYNMASYNSENGVISCMCKIYKDGETVGLLVADILPSSLFSQKLRYSSFDSDCRFAITNGSSLLDGGDNVKEITAEGGSLGKYYTSESDIVGGGKLSMYVSIEKFIYQCYFILFVMMIYTGLLLIAVSCISRSVSESAVSPLERLNGQMNEIRKLSNAPTHIKSDRKE